MKIQKLLSNLDKDKKLKSAFRAIKVDMDIMNENHAALKGSADEWIMFLDHENSKGCRA
jgi:hypothetical protein